VKTLPSETEVRETQKQLIVAMAADDPQLMRWLKGFVKAYGE